MTANQKEVQAQFARALTASGVPSTFHELTLSNYGEAGLKLRDHLVQVIPKVPHGEGVTFIGKGKRSRELFVLAARALIVGGVTTQVISTVRLQQVLQMNIDPAMLERVLACKALFLWDFYDPGDEPAFTRYQRKDLEDFFYQHTENGGALFPQSPVQPVADKHWWSETLIDVLANKNTEWKV